MKNRQLYFYFFYYFEPCIVGYIVVPLVALNFKIYNFVFKSLTRKIVLKMNEKAWKMKINCLFLLEFISDRDPQSIFSGHNQFENS